MEIHPQGTHPVKVTYTAFIIWALVTLLHGSALAAELGPEMRIDDPTQGGAATSSSLGTTMCAKPDDVVFSCPLDKSKKIVSMCVANGATSSKGRFYYAYGHDGAPELVYPASGQPSDGAFTRTHLGFAGNTGGYAYGFNNKGFKYTVYSISGESNLQRGGVIVQRASDSKVVAKMSCQAGKITETESDPIIDATLTWKSDGSIESKGLPTR
jgi:hypothetical protein